MTNYRILTVAALLLAPTAACDTGPPPPAAGSGVADVEEARLELDLEIGSVDDDADALSSIAQILPRDDGSAFILDQMAQEVLEFSPTGELVQRFGGPGSGPGEFTVPGGMGWWAGRDSIWVSDAVLPRLTVFSTKGEVGRTIALPAGGAITAGMRWYGVLGTQSIVVVSQSRPAGGGWGPVQVTPHDSPATILQVERHESSIPIISPEPGFMRDPVADGPLIRFSPNTDRIVVVERTAAEADGPAVVVVHAVDQRGDTAWTTRLDYQPTPIATAVRDSIAQAAYERLESLSIRRQMSSGEFDRLYRETIQLPVHHPPITSAVPTDDGGVWVVWTDLGEGSRVTVLDRFGREALGLQVEGDVAATLSAVAGDFVWAIAEGPFEIPLARRYRIR